jgi:hypothetical protein
MAERDKLIKSGQLTLPRLLFLAAIGGIIVLTVYYGGVWLSVGYWLMTLGISVLLFLIAIDYGVKMDRVDLSNAQSTAAGTPPEPVTTPAEIKSAIETRQKRGTKRPVKRRR